MEPPRNETIPTLTRLRARISAVDNNLLNSLATISSSWEMAHTPDESVSPFMRIASFSLYASALDDLRSSTEERYRFTNLVGFVKFQYRRTAPSGETASWSILQNIKYHYPEVKHEDYLGAALVAEIPDELEEIFGVTFPERETQVISRLQHRLDRNEEGFLTQEGVAAFWTCLFKISRVAQVITIMELQQREQQFEPGNATA